MPGAVCGVALALAAALDLAAHCAEFTAAFALDLAAAFAFCAAALAF